MQQQSAVTPERFAQGLTWQDWLAAIDRNQDKFAENYESVNLNLGDLVALRALSAKPNGPAKVLVLGEAWCPDVFRGLPVLAKLAEETGWELRVFFRDQNLDIMNEFLNRGEFQSIPTVVFYTKENEYIGHWIERAQKAIDEMPVLRAIVDKMNDPDLPAEQREQLMEEYVAFQRGPIWASWKEAQLSETRALLEAKVRA